VSTLDVGDDGGGTQPGVVISGDEAAETVELRMAGGGVNHGTITLTGSASSNSELEFPSSTFTNHGTIDLLQGAGGGRTLGGNTNAVLQNDGTIHIAANDARNGCTTTFNGATGTIDVDSGAAWNTTCGTHTLVVEGGLVQVDGTLQASPFSIVDGRVAGSGTITGGVANGGGTVAPGNSAGVLTINGGYAQTEGGTLELEFGGPGAGTGHDRLAVTGAVSLSGTVDITVTAVPSPSTDLITSGGLSGEFVDVFGVPTGWLTYGANNLSLLAVPTFPDVPLTHPFFLDIEWAAVNGIVNGFGDGTFRPANTATRQAVVAMLYRLAGSPDGDDPTCASAPFSDVGVSHAFCGEIEWASDEGLVNGFGDGTFRPANTITRQALMAILYRFAGSPDGDDPTCTAAPFPDVPTSHAFCGEIEWASDEGLANGFADGNFKPANTVTRQAIAAFFHRFVDEGLLIT
jgi:hypothetical protein